MRKTQSIEIVGIGNFDIYPIAIKEEFKTITQDKKPLKKVLVKKGIPSEYAWIDSHNNRYEKDKVFYDVYGLIIQEVKRTEKVKNYEIIGKDEIYNLTETNFCILNCDETTRRIFKEKVKNQAIRFRLKKSSVGFSFYVAYIFEMSNELVMVTGKGSIPQAIKEFKKNKTAKEEINKVIVQKVQVSADDLEIPIKV